MSPDLLLTITTDGRVILRVRTAEFYNTVAFLEEVLATWHLKT
jgi:hypothetical protein